jgi:oligoribonuclease (3'-5' exoribonuclease)
MIQQVRASRPAEQLEIRCFLTGDCVSTDRAFLKAKMPKFEALFFKANFDIASLYRAAKFWSTYVSHNQPPRGQ